MSRKTAGTLFIAVLIIGIALLFRQQIGRMITYGGYRVSNSRPQHPANTSTPATGTKSNTPTPSFPTSYTATSPFGVLPNFSEGTVLSVQSRLAVAKTLGVSLMRTTEVAGKTPPYTAQQLAQAGIHILMNIKKPADMSLTAFQADIAQKIAQVAPTVIVVDNEEDGNNFYQGTVDEYIAELKAVVETAHQYGVKVADGGISGGPARLVTWNYYWTTGQYAQADAFAIKAFRDSGVPRLAKLYDDLPNQSNPTRPILANHADSKLRLERSIAFLAAFKTIPMDYVNFHWYQTTNGAMTEVVNYFRQATGKPVITNEIGQYDTNGAVTTALMQEAAGLQLPYVIWYSGDGGEGKAVALTNKDGSLRPSGAAFKAFIYANY